jgi:Patatin-like phospholipase
VDKRQIEEPITDVDAVYKAEGAHIRAARLTGEHDRPMIGLALSGGGIRSATFNLGVLQALATLKLLRKFDYLSTVSGGGYVGAWLSALIHRSQELKRDSDATPQHVAPAEKGNYQEKTVDAESIVANTAKNSDGVIRHLRHFSNYLTPRVGTFTLDTWTGIATYLRNLMTNAAILVSLAIAVVFFAQSVYAASGALMEVSAFWLLSIALVCLFLVAAVIGVYIDRQLDGTADDGIGQAVWIGCAFPTFAAAWLTSIAAQSFAERWLEHGVAQTAVGSIAFPPMWQWIAAFAVGNMLIWTFCGALRMMQRKRRHADSPLSIPWSDFGELMFACAIAGGFAGILLWMYADSYVSGALGAYLSTETLISWLGNVMPNTAPGLAPAHIQGAFHASAGLLIVAISLSVSVALQIALAKRALSESDREWLGRLGGVLYLFGCAVLAIAFVVAVGPALVIWWQSASVFAWISGTAAGAWLLQTLAAIFLGRSTLTGGRAPKKPRLNALISIGPYVFVFGLLVIITALTSRWVDAHFQTPPANVWSAIDLYCKPIAVAETGAATAKATKLVSECAGFNRALSLPLLTMAYTWWMLLLAALAAAFAAFFLSWRVDINLFSFQMFYRNRLTRAYLGASRIGGSGRKSNGFTSLSYSDDVNYADLAHAGAVQRPLHLVNVALNQLGERDLGLQERKSMPFTFSPLHTGFTTSGNKNSIIGFFQPTAQREDAARTKRPFDAITLGFAMATSGAAASPAMGHHSSPALALLLTTFNVRLGAWFKNPRHGPVAEGTSPTVGLWWLLRELIGLANSESEYVYLSDGGHFENTGAYALIARRVPLIVLSDCGADPDYRFDDLANLIRLVQLDFNTLIDIDFEAFLPNERGASAQSHVIGKIYYPATDCEAASMGTLIVIKPTIAAKSAELIAQYRAQNADFPQQTTADQWFSESQFEAYRQLGFDCATDAFAPWSKGRSAFDAVAGR